MFQLNGAPAKKGDSYANEGVKELLEELVDSL